MLQASLAPAGATGQAARSAAVFLASRSVREEQPAQVQIVRVAIEAFIILRQRVDCEANVRILDSGEAFAPISSAVQVGRAQGRIKPGVDCARGACWIEYGSAARSWRSFGACADIRHTLHRFSMETYDADKSENLEP